MALQEKNEGAINREYLRVEWVAEHGNKIKRISGTSAIHCAKQEKFSNFRKNAKFHLPLPTLNVR